MVYFLVKVASLSIKEWAAFEKMFWGFSIIVAVAHWSWVGIGEDFIHEAVEVAVSKYQSVDSNFSLSGMNGFVVPARLKL